MDTIHSRHGNKIGKGKNQNPRGYTEKKILINQVILSKIWDLTYVEIKPTDINLNIRKGIHIFLGNYTAYRNGRVGHKGH